MKEFNGLWTHSAATLFLNMLNMKKNTIHGNKANTAKNMSNMYNMSKMYNISIYKLIHNMLNPLI